MDETDVPSPPYPGWCMVDDSAEEIKKIEELVSQLLQQEKMNPDAISSIDVRVKFGGLDISIKKDNSGPFGSAAGFCKDIIIAHPLKALSLLWLAKNVI